MKLITGVTAVLVTLALSAGCSNNTPAPTTPDPVTPAPTTPTPPAPTPTPAALSSVTLSPSSVTGDGSSVGTVTLSAAAPSGGASVTVSSSNEAVSLSGPAIVLAGATTQTFLITTHAPSADRLVTITATYAGVTKTASLLVRATAPTPPPGSPTIAGHWTGTLASCCFGGGPPVSIVVDITQTGDTYTGQCTYGSNPPDPLTSFEQVGSGSDFQDFSGSCASGVVDARFFPGDDYISWIWNIDYMAVLSRH